MAKNKQVVAIVDENKIEQCFATHIVHSCQQYCYTRFRLSNYNCSILLISVNNVGSKTICSILLNSRLSVFTHVQCMYSTSLHTMKECNSNNAKLTNFKLHHLHVVSIWLSSIKYRIEQWLVGRGRGGGVVTTSNVFQSMV